MIDPIFLSGVFCGAGGSVENTTGKSPRPRSRTNFRICRASGQAIVFESLAILTWAGSVLRAAPIDDIKGISFCSHHS